MNIQTETVHKQLQRLMQGGLSIEDACSALRNLGLSARSIAEAYRETHVRLVPAKDCKLIIGARGRRVEIGPSSLLRNFDACEREMNRQDRKTVMSLLRPVWETTQAFLSMTGAFAIALFIACDRGIVVAAAAVVGAIAWYSLHQLIHRGGTR